MTILMVILCVLMNTFGQLFLKISALANRNKYLYLMSGYGLSFCTVVVSVFLMKFIQLKTFTLIMGLNYISILFVSQWFFNERLTLNKLIGTILVLAGVVVFNL